MYKEKPTKSLESLFIFTPGFSPLFFAHLIYSPVESFDNMKPVDNKNRFGTPVLNSADIGPAHIAGSKPNLVSLFFGQGISEKHISSLAPFTLSDPDYM